MSTTGGRGGGERIGSPGVGGEQAAAAMALSESQLKKMLGKVRREGSVGQSAGPPLLTDLSQGEVLSHLSPSLPLGLRP